MTTATHTPTKAETTRDSILAAAAKLFSERGYDATGIRDIEAAAGLNRGVSAYHFKNKEALWKAAVEYIFAPYISDLEGKKELLLAIEPTTRVRLILEQFVRMSAETPHLNQLMIQESLAKTWRIDWIIENYLRPAHLLRNELLHDDPIGRTLESDPHVYYAVLGASMHVFSVSVEAKTFYGVDAFDPAFVDRHAKFIGDVIMGLAQAAAREQIDG